MRAFQLLALLGAVSLTHAQETNFSPADDRHDLVYSIDRSAPPQGVNYNSALVLPSGIVAVEVSATPQASEPKFMKRTDGTCQPKPTGAGFKVEPDTSYAFLNSPQLASAASFAPTPSNYTQAFRNLHASSSAYGFLGYIALDSYDTNLCASKCNEQDGCLAINIFFERNPSQEVGPKCPNPPSTTHIKCAFWSGLVTIENTNNAGYTDHDFEVVITGSNGYNKGKMDRVKGYSGVKGSSPRALSNPLFVLALVPLLGRAM
ncbi:uncharacterized protein BDR25DRAFT_39938 [Lindgomyces ingoldianus]|uniref:Uncharacterized protein n=1 Tax=Lindgomyces ingoldianus TaxID=673940 RepID=A0ACB6QTD3_9PLEO|nr:uncharacterized protein BDR25DRAFT_39938 [Lindgomyces ingoldianus]KAF2469823.1 hypothetical protein BDR25DRAFT_39938 [Lindgomyces ingoldianus]